jgi:hypothetical protein
VTVPISISPVHRLEACATEVVAIECGERLRHTIHFTDSATPTRKAKPAGVLGAEIWVSILPVGQPTPSPSFQKTGTAKDRREDHDLFANRPGNSRSA